MKWRYQCEKRPFFHTSEIFADFMSEIYINALVKCTICFFTICQHIVIKYFLPISLWIVSQNDEESSILLLTVWEVALTKCAAILYPDKDLDTAFTRSLRTLLKIAMNLKSISLQSPKNDLDYGIQIIWIILIENYW